MRTMTYKQLNQDQQARTYENFKRLCQNEAPAIQVGTFEEYHDEQLALDLTFDMDTLECLG